MNHLPHPRSVRRLAGAALLLSLLAIALPGRVLAQADQDAAKLAWQYRLFDSEHLLLRESFVGVSFLPIFTPAFVRLGAAIGLAFRGDLLR